VSINDEFVECGWDTFSNRPIFVYGDNVDARMLWTSNPIKFNVIRYMCDLDVDGIPTVWKSMPGKYER